MAQRLAELNDPGRRARPGRLPLIIDIVIGVVVAGAVWWLIDDQSLSINRSLDIIQSPLGSFLVIAVVVLVATVVLARSTPSLAAATVVMAAGIVIGGYGSGRSLIELGDGDLAFTILRGAHDPAVWALSSAWLAILANRLLRPRWRDR